MNLNQFFDQDSCINEAFGHYQVIEELGQGGMGKVYKALDTELNRIVALKVLLDQNDPEFVKRFLREARSIASLKHPNIIRIYEIKQFRKVFYYVMEYIEGVTLHDWLVSNKDYKKTAMLMEKVALAIDYAHSKSIIHHDLKPGNIMIDKNDIPYVMDFGLVKLVDVPGQLTKTGDILGTPTYMSPEQAQGDQKLIDTKTDIYSLGVVLYEMLCGQVPFDDCSPWNILVKVIEKNPTPVREIDETIPVALENICLRAMAKQKRDRYDNAKEFTDDLRCFYKGRKINPRRSSRIFRKKSSIVTNDLKC